MQQSTPCTCEHCQLCPVARTVARLMSSESGTTDDNNKNIPPSMTASEASLPPLSEAYSVEETIQKIKMINNNNSQQQQDVAAAEIHDMVVAQHLQQQQQYQYQQQQFQADVKNDRWDAIEKILADPAAEQGGIAGRGVKSRRSGGAGDAKAAPSPAAAAPNEAVMSGTS